MTFFAPFYLLLIGFGLGLLISAPVGPVNILCIQHSLARGFWAGVAVGFGALLADVMIALMAALGLTYISGFMVTYEMPIKLIGGCILLGFGMRLLIFHPHMLAPGDASLHPFRHLGSSPQSFFLTVTNPGAILGIFAVVGSAGIAIGGLESLGDVSCLIGGLTLGAALWWVGLARLTSLFRKKMTEKRFRFINRCAALVLFLGGGALVINALFFL